MQKKPRSKALAIASLTVGLLLESMFGECRVHREEPQRSSPSFVSCSLPLDFMSALNDFGAGNGGGDFAPLGTRVITSTAPTG